LRLKKTSGMSTNAEGAVATDREDVEKVEGRRRDDDDDDGLIERKKGIAENDERKREEKSHSSFQTPVDGKTL
jgi:hypothetical protein